MSLPSNIKIRTIVSTLLLGGLLLGALASVVANLNRSFQDTRPTPRSLFDCPT